MPLEIIGAGYGRTGTLSTSIALNELGFPCYHMTTLLSHPRRKQHFQFWYEVSCSDEGSQHDWERVYADHRAAVDNPTCCVWQELAEACPKAKVILTLHPKGPDEWYNSYMETISEKSWQFAIFKLDGPYRRWARGMRLLSEHRSLKNSMRSRSTAVAQYQQRIEDVKAAIPPERLLIFSVDQGWDPLCEFLNVDAPDTPFPKVNERAEFKQRFGKTKRAINIAIAGLLILAVALVGIIWTIWTLWTA